MTNERNEEFGFVREPADAGAHMPSLTLRVLFCGCGDWGLEIEFERFAEIVEGFLLGSSVAGYIDLGALGDEEIIFFSDACGEGLFH
jgi:hypothetical protein